MDTWKKNVKEEVVKPWKRLPKEVVDFLSYEEFQSHGEVGFRDMDLWWNWQCWINWT